MALWISDTEPVELSTNASEEELQSVIRAVYRQVLGNRHVMESQRLTSAESLLRNGDITVRGFVTLVAQSDLYRSLFFDKSSPYRFIELSFNHLLGRAPMDQTEITEHVLIYNTHGYEAEINSFVDSAEYLDSFGEMNVPYTRGSQTQAGMKNVGFNRTFALNRGFATTDAKSAQLIRDVAGNLATTIKAPSRIPGATSSMGKRFRITSSKAGGSGVTRSNATFEVGYNQLSQKIRSIQKTGGKVLSVTEI
jgi:phycoerythrin-associated linker protein